MHQFQTRSSTKIKGRENNLASSENCNRGIDVLSWPERTDLFKCQHAHANMARFLLALDCRQVALPLCALPKHRMKPVKLAYKNENTKVHIISLINKNKSLQLQNNSTENITACSSWTLIQPTTLKYTKVAYEKSVTLHKLC
jgi:hypothetical protein